YLEKTQETGREMKLRLSLGVIGRMMLYGAGAGALLGLLYFWIGTVVGIVIGAVVGAIIGLFDGLLMAVLIAFLLRPVAAISHYGRIIGISNAAVAAIVTSWVLYSIVGQALTWTPV